MVGELGVEQLARGTGANGKLNLAYQGATTTMTCVAPFNGSSVVSVAAGCAGIGCGTAALASWDCAPSNSNNLSEVDVCIYGGSPKGQTLAGWSLETDMIQGSLDLVNVLTQEFGHAIGLFEHELGVMSVENGMETSNTIMRLPWGDDITRTQSAATTGTCFENPACDGPAYGTEAQHIYWREYTDGAGWGAETMLPSSLQTWAQPTAAVGLYGAHGAKVVIGVLGTNQVAYLLRADYPLRTASAWDAKFIDPATWGGAARSWQPPAVAAKGMNSAWWVAAWSQQEVNFAPVNCHGITVDSSPDAFETGQVMTLGGTTDPVPICTVSAPALAWDEAAGRFVLAYLARSKAWDPVNNLPMDGRIHFRTSTDGVTWGVDQDLRVFTIDAPGLACQAFAPGGGSNCLMTAINGSWFSGSGGTPTYYPGLVDQAFSVDATTGTVAFGGLNFVNNWIQRTPPAAQAPFWGDRWWQGMVWSGTRADWPLGRGTPQTNKDYALPSTFASWETMSGTSDHAVALAAAPHGERVYAVTVKP